MASTETLTFFTINDVYEMLPNEEGLGGLPQLKTLLESETKKSLDENPSTVVLNTINGDFLSASQVAEHFKGKHMIDILNQIGFDYAVLGNHEFDFGSEVLRNRMNEASFKWLGSNVLNAESKSSLWHDKILNYDVVTVGQIKFGIFGLCTAETPTLSYPGEDVYFSDILKTAATVVTTLKESEDVDVVIAITHLSIGHDKLLAKKVPHIDVILGGHDHQPFTLYQGSTVIHKSGQNAFWLGKFTLSVEKQSSDGSVKVYPSWEMKCNRNISPDPEILSLISDTYSIETPESRNRALTFLAVSLYPLDTSNIMVRGGTSNFGHLVADCLRRFFKTDFGLINGGFIRGDKVYSAKTSVTIGLIETEMPFPRPAVSVKILGKHLKEALECHLASFPALSGSYPHVSGCRIVYDASLKTITSFTILNDEDVDLEKVYTIATSSFIVAGGDGIKTWPTYSKIINESPLKISQVVIKELAQRRTCDYDRTEKRISIINE